MGHPSLEKIIALQKKTSDIRNICILAHVDHGKLHFSLLFAILRNFQKWSCLFLSLMGADICSSKLSHLIKKKEKHSNLVTPKLKREKIAFKMQEEHRYFWQPLCDRRLNLLGLRPFYCQITLAKPDCVRKAHLPSNVLDMFRQDHC